MKESFRDKETESRIVLFCLQYTNLCKNTRSVESFITILMFSTLNTLS